MNNVPTPVAQTVHQQRAAAYHTLHELADHHGLPQPMGVNFFDEVYGGPRSIDIRLDDNRRGSVQGWADVLGLGAVFTQPVPTGGSGFSHVQADASALDGPQWLGFGYIRVWCRCPILAPAEYAREPDNADEQVPVPPGVEGGRVGAGPGRHTDTPADTAKDA